MARELGVMRIVIQRVNEASVEIDNKIKSSIGVGLLVLVGIEKADTTADSEWLAGKVTGLRIFDDENGVMNVRLRCDAKFWLSANLRFTP